MKRTVIGCLSVKRPHGRALANESCHGFQTFSRQPEDLATETTGSLNQGAELKKLIHQRIIQNGFVNWMNWLINWGFIQPENINKLFMNCRLFTNGKCLLLLETLIGCLLMAINIYPKEWIYIGLKIQKKQPPHFSPPMTKCHTFCFFEKKKKVVECVNQVT